VNETFHEWQPFPHADRLCDAFLSNHVANRGSRAQGQAFLLVAAQAFDSQELSNWRKSVTHERLPAHFATVFGTVMRILKVCHAQCVRLFLFLSLRTLISSAIRLGILGPMAAQSLQSHLALTAEETGARCASLRIADATQTSTLLDVWQGAHDRLYSRLFQT
jgi:urease accessory protein